MKFQRALAAGIGLVLGYLIVCPAFAAETNVAVAANFTDAAKEIAAAFKAKTGHDAILSFGSSGQLYSQITQDAPSSSPQ
jgi:molybdate transport system substrate-binding protein